MSLIFLQRQKKKKTPTQKPKVVFKIKLFPHIIQGQGENKQKEQMRDLNIVLTTCLFRWSRRKI